MPRTFLLFVALALICFLGGCGERDPNYVPSEADISDAVGAALGEAGWKASQSAMEIQHSTQQMQTR